MQNFVIENKKLLIENKNQIKKLWLNIFFDDDEKTVDVFLENVFENEKGVGAFCEDKLIAMILFLNSKIISKDKKNNSVYFYAVCTDEKYRNKGVMKNLFEFACEVTKAQGFEICFLVPENEGLFNMYEKFSFKRTISYEEKCFNRVDIYNKNTITQKTDFCYSDYVSLKTKLAKKTPTIIWEEDEFNFIFSKMRKDVSFVFTNDGYAVFEKRTQDILVWEFCGDTEKIASLIFKSNNDIEKLIFRVPVETEKTDFGMTRNLLDSVNKMDSIYFGMPYC